MLRSPGWIDGEPLCDVLPMAGVLDRYYRIVIDGQAVITGCQSATPGREPTRAPPAVPRSAWRTRQHSAT
jgi:hypothetical protein